jgi:hypothetical protein
LVTLVLGTDVNVGVAGLKAETAGLGAGSPGVPPVFTVDGARVGVAVLRGRLGVASFAAVTDVGDDGADTRVDAAAAKFGASGEAGPAGEDAIDGAGLGAAGLVVDVVRALDTSVKNVDND